MSTSQHNKVYSPGTKPDTTGDEPDLKGAAVPDAKGAADKKIPSVTQEEKAGMVADQAQ